MKVNYETTVAVPREQMWEFIKTFNNWAPMVKGYQSHEMVNDKESYWVIKAQFGSFSRKSRFHATITEWQPMERVAFELKGMDDPVTGVGAVQLRSVEPEGSTNIWAEVGFVAGGALAPLVDRLVAPWVRTMAEELVVKVVAAVRPPAQSAECKQTSA